MPDHPARQDAGHVGDGGRYVPDARLVRVSRTIIRALQDPGGAYPASPNFSAYQGHCWFRDGTFIAEAARRHGDEAGSARFHQWCSRVVLDRADTITDLVRRAHEGEPVAVTELLPTRYTLDGADGTDAWWDFQLDGYGTWLWALGEHTRTTSLPSPDCVSAAALVVDYLCAFWDRPCYDWWEEHIEQRHVSTLGALRGGLASVLRTAELAAGLGTATHASATRALAAIDALVSTSALGSTPRTPAGRLHLVKWLGSDAVDASLLSCVEPFRLPLPHGVAAATVTAVESELAVEAGVHRYLLDTYYGGGQWLLLSGFMAWALIAQGRPHDAEVYLRWIEKQADPDGSFPEQVNAHLLAPSRETEWIERWGSSASPLLWSHAMYLIAVDALAHHRGIVHDAREELEVNP